jgi:hypothetical protein
MLDFIVQAGQYYAISRLLLPFLLIQVAVNGMAENREDKRV